MSEHRTDRRADRWPDGPTGLTRRQLLLAAGAGSAVVLSGGLAGCAPAPPDLVVGDDEARWGEPPVLASAGGRLDIELVAAPTTVAHGAGRRGALAYNGTVPGPTWRVRPGDRVTVTLVNGLDEPTNLHTHGLHVSPRSPGDDPFVHVPPGGRHTYVYEIPADHRSGLFWYHPHHHGHVAGQVEAGLAGAIIVGDGLDVPLAGLPERLLILTDPRAGAVGATTLAVSPMEQMVGREGDRVLVNGRSAPTLPATAGTLQRWRVLNASPSRYYALRLEGHRFHLIGTDNGRTARPRPLDELRLVPGERADVLVPVDRAGSYRLTTGPVDRGQMMMGMGRIVSSASGPLTVATLEVTGSAGGPPAVPGAGADVVDLRTVVPSATRTVTFSMGGMMGGGGMGGGGMGGGGMGGGGMGGGGRGGMMGPGGMGPGGMGPMGMAFLIDGRSFEHDRVDAVVARDTVEDWVIRNTSTMNHPFHLHTWAFQVVDHSAGPPPGPEWNDVVDVPAGGWVRLRIPFTRFDGRTVYHCHLLDHEDRGMMATIAAH